MIKGVAFEEGGFAHRATRPAANRCPWLGRWRRRRAPASKGPYPRASSRTSRPTWTWKRGGVLVHFEQRGAAFGFAFLVRCPQARREHGVLVLRQEKSPSRVKRLCTRSAAQKCTPCNRYRLQGMVNLCSTEKESKEAA